ncbi:MAG: hypothetical protein HC890_01300 [Chloroflexaceae bacterium]|nr:hypothetical protein [Chloroflexaceae bacterium]
MSYSEEFVEEGQAQAAASEYPVVFGITFTPSVGGVICALLGIATTAYLWFTLVEPARQKGEQLEQDRQAKETQLQQVKAQQTGQALQELNAQIQQTQALQPQILALFASESSLDTLLLDVNQFFPSEKEGLQLRSYAPVEPQAVVVSDGSLGELVNGKIKRQSINLQVEGEFSEIQALMQDLERLQSLLVVRELKLALKEPGQLTSGEINENGEWVPTETRDLKADFRLDALLPVN